MRAGYVVSGVVFLSLATIFGLVALTLAIFYGILSAGGSTCIASATATAADLAVCNAYTAAAIVTSVAAIAFFAVSTLFLWTGFKSPAPTHVVTVMQPVMQFCPTCRAQVGPGQKFCANCGTKLA